MIQRVDGAGPPEGQGDGLGERFRRARSRGDRRVEVGLLVAYVLVGVSFAAAALLSILAVTRGGVTALATGTRATGLEAVFDLDRVDPERIARRIAWLADPGREGRDTPGRGLRAAQHRVAEWLDGAGVGAPPAGLLQGGSAVRLPADLSGEPDGALARRAHVYTAETVALGTQDLEAPLGSACRLEFAGGADLVLGEDFMPLNGSTEPGGGYAGAARGPVAFAGFAIHNEREAYDDIAPRDLAGKVALVLPGEPDVGFGGPEEATAESSVWNKLDALAEVGAAGALVVADRPGPVPYHATRAQWIPPSFDRERRGLPTLVVSHAVAERLLGASPRELAERSAETPLVGADAPSTSTEVRLVARTERRPRRLVNVLGFVEGHDPTLLVVVTAHLDHIGVGPRGRIGAGANDNASGVAAALELAHLVAADPLGPSVLFAFTSGEEDGLLGARALARDLSGRFGRTALCLNLDMVGHGAADACVVLRGAPGRGNGALDRRIERAAASRAHGLASVSRVDDGSFFTRSDHYAFFERGVPSAFVFQDWPLREGVYHTWRDVPEGVDARKVARVARFAALLLATFDPEP